MNRLNLSPKALDVDKAAARSAAVRQARVAARQARARAVLAWWPLSWALALWAALLGWWASHLEAEAAILRARIRDAIDLADSRHRVGRRQAHRDQGGR